MAARERVREHDARVIVEADVQWLLDQGLIITPSLRHDDAGSPEARKELSLLHELRGSLRRSEALLARGEESSTEDRFADDLRAWEETVTRVHAIQLREFDHVNAVPIANEWSNVLDQPATRADVVRLVRGDN